MKPLIILAALAAAALVLRRRRPVTVDADDSEVVGMPTYRVMFTTAGTSTLAQTDWDAFFDTAGRRN